MIFASSQLLPPYKYVFSQDVFLRSNAVPEFVLSTRDMTAVRRKPSPCSQGASGLVGIRAHTHVNE